MRIYRRAEDTDMKPGNYLARCVAVREKKRGRNRVAVLIFVIEDGKFANVALRHWLELSDWILADSKFGRAYGIATQGKIDGEVSLEAFADKLYVVRAGYRKSEGNRFNADNVQVRKDETDFLRVHEILSLFDDKKAAPDQANERETRRRKVRVLKPAPSDGERRN